MGLAEDRRKLLALKKLGFMTGSVRFGCENPQDEDWVIRSTDWNRIVGYELGLFYYTPHDYDLDEFRCFFLDWEGTKYNFIIPNTEEDYLEMRKATRLMTRIPVRFIQNKTARVNFFEVLKDLVSGRMDKPMKSNINDLPLDNDDIPF